MATVSLCWKFTSFTLPLKTTTKCKMIKKIKFSVQSCSDGNEQRNRKLKNKSIIQGLTEDKIRAKPRWSIGPDNFVIKCNWLLIGHNALHLYSFNYVWLSCPSIDGCSHCKLSSSMQLSVALMIFDCGDEWLWFERFPSFRAPLGAWHITVPVEFFRLRASDVDIEDSKYQIL